MCDFHNLCQSFRKSARESGFLSPLVVRFRSTLSPSQQEYLFNLSGASEKEHLISLTLEGVSDYIRGSNLDPLISNFTIALISMLQPNSFERSLETVKQNLNSLQLMQNTSSQLAPVSPSLVESAPAALVNSGIADRVEPIVCNDTVGDEHLPPPTGITSPPSLSSSKRRRSKNKRAASDSGSTHTKVSPPQKKHVYAKDVPQNVNDLALMNFEQFDKLRKDPDLNHFCRNAYSKASQALAPPYDRVCAKRCFKFTQRRMSGL